jgi:hypothetical protein
MAPLTGLLAPRCGRMVILLFPAAWIAATLAASLIACQLNFPAGIAALTCALGSLVAANLPLPLILVAGGAIMLGVLNATLKGMDLVRANDHAMVVLGIACSLWVVMLLVAGLLASVRVA